MPKNVMCKNCNYYRNDWCEEVTDSPDPDLVRDCPYFCQKTNADRIRAMSDEELAAWLESLTPHDCGCCAYQQACRFEHDTETVDYTEKYHCGEGIMAWLQQPAEEVER